MSLILDALQRSQEQQLPSSQPVAMTHMEAPKSKRRWGLIIGALLGMGTLLVLGRLYVPWVSNAHVRSPEGAALSAIQEGVPPSTKQPPPTTVEAVAIDISTAPVPQLAGTAMYDKEVEALYESIETTVAADLLEQPATVQDNVGTQNPIEEQEGQPIDIEALLRKAQAQMGEAPLTPHPAPLLDRLSQQQKDRIPTLIYNEHSWSTESPSVVINGQRLLAGGRLNGITVVEVLADSVILSWEGVQFRLVALNSWVNL